MFLGSLANTNMVMFFFVSTRGVEGVYKFDFGCV